jgi:hypothetical protein
MDFNKPHIYLRTILKTGKSYIGKHNGNKGNYYRGSGIDWIIAYKEYVIEPESDLKEIILEYVEDISKLNEREEFWLKKYDAANNPKFYNRTNRTRGWTIVTKEQREKLRISHLGKKQTEEASQKKREKMKGKTKHTEESKKKIGKKNSIPKPFGFSEKLQKPKTDQHKENLSISKSKRPIVQILNGEIIKEWRSVAYASRTLNLSQSNINTCVLYGGIYKGFEWKKLK